ncbi:hypothetical protein BO71DRAFT_284700, partial [Aspergillus ellipticus CBS 707.79]
LSEGLPCSSLIDSLICLFFNHQQQSQSAFLHHSTLSCMTQNSLLLTAVVASGATLSGVASRQKLGFAIQEIVRVEIICSLDGPSGKKFELWLLQAILCVVETGFWSGDKGKMVDAESMAQSLFRILRRSGAFRRFIDEHPPVIDTDTGEALEMKWQQWVERESLCRLASRAFLFDAHVAFALLMNPHIRYSEMALPLPSTSDLWEASNAGVWKTIYLSRPTLATPSPHLALRDCLRNPFVLAKCAPHQDLRFSLLLLLAAVWAMIWETLHLLAQTDVRPDYSHASLAMRHRDLCEILLAARTLVTDHNLSPCPGIILQLDLLKMHPHICIEEADRVLPLVQHWARESTSRQALWSAGQILLAARSFPAGTLRGVYALAVHHACVCLWAHTVVSQTIFSVDGELGLNQYDITFRTPVILDGAPGTAIQQFLALGDGQPSITTSSGDAIAQNCSWAPITDVQAVVDSFSEVLQQNHNSSASSDDLPFVVQNLVQLMQGLGIA